MTCLIVILLCELNSTWRLVSLSISPSYRFIHYPTFPNFPHTPPHYYILSRSSILFHIMTPSRLSPEPKTSSQSTAGLTPEQVTAFNRDGYLIIPNALDEQTLTKLLEETHSMLDNFSLDDHPMTKFSTGEKSEHVGDDYFLSSGDKIRFFFEEGRELSSSIASIYLQQSQMPLIQPETLQNQKPKQSTKLDTTSTLYPHHSRLFFPLPRRIRLQQSRALCPLNNPSAYNP